MDSEFNRRADRLLEDVFSADVEVPPAKEKKMTSRRSALLMGLSTGVIGLIIGAAASGGGEGTPSPSPTVTVSALDREEPRETLKPGTSAPKESFGEGDHFVGKDIRAGTYRSTGASEGLIDLCIVSVLDKDGDVLEMKSGNGDSPVIIEVAATGDVVSVTGCKPFARVR